MLCESALTNRCQAPINMLHNRGTIKNLGLVNVYASADPAATGGFVVKNAGAIHRYRHLGVAAEGLQVGIPLDASSK